MSPTLDINEYDHPECREELEGALRDLGEDVELNVLADHDPEPVLRTFQEEEGTSLEWEYQEKGPEEWNLLVQKQSGPGDRTLDVREMPPPERHGAILDKFQSLNTDQSLVIVNDHDPKPLFYELRSIHGDTFDWEYEKKESGAFRVRITKTDESQPMPEEASTRVDVRIIPPQDRHESIFHRFDLLAPGDAMEIVADHDPAPLRQQLEDIHGSAAFEWNYRKQEPREVRVLLKKAGGTDSDSNGEDPDETSVDVDELDHLDVRSYRPQKRHDLIYEKYGNLEGGDAFVLINDHDPKPLYYQMKEEMEGELRWEYVESGGDEWKVLIGKQ